MLEFDFNQFDDKEFLQSFKEDSVRELIIAPILKELGFDTQGSFRVERSRTLTSPTIIGSNKKINAKDLVIPDYTLYIDSKPHCVLDAKAPKEPIDQESSNERQVFYYAINKDMKAPYYALCNGLELTLFSASTQEMLEIFSCKELFCDTNKRNFLKQYLTTLPKSLKQTQTPTNPQKSDEWYLARELPQEIKNPQKQKAKRYFGCNAYFTRQSYDVAAQNIKTFTNNGDVVLDPFGGSGLTAIEAMMHGRVGIHTDLNPLSVFITKALSTECDLDMLYNSAQEILEELETLRPKSEKEAKALLKNAKYYPNAIDEEFGKIATQKTQDSMLWIPFDESLLWTTKGLTNLYQLFSKTQLAELALLRKLIFKKTTPSGSKDNRIQKRNLRYSLLLAFYNTLSLINLTYHETKSRKGAAGNYFAFYYRYKLAKEPYFLDVRETFKRKAGLIIKGKKELRNSPYFYQSYYEPLEYVIKDFSGAMLANRGDLEVLDSVESKNNGAKIFQADATNLQEIESQSIDFIYTDPPYGAKIPYLDLSTMWNAWLDFPVNRTIREKECIEKGSLNKSRQEYYDLMVKSLREMYRVLKFNRWLAFIFQHQDPRLWQILRKSAEEIGFEYVGTIRQSNGQKTIKQRQFAATMVNGQLIVYFRKVKNKDTEIKIKLGDNTKTLLEVAKTEIIEKNGATLAEINDALVVSAMNEGFLDEYLEITDMKYFVLQHFDYDKESGKYHCNEAQEPKIPLEIKAKYFLVNYFNKCKKENRAVFFSDICFEVIPKLTNGVTPDERFIKEILEDDLAEIADEKTGEWRLKPQEMRKMDTKKYKQGTLKGFECN